MPRLRIYATNAARQAAYRKRKVRKIRKHFGLLDTSDYAHLQKMSFAGLAANFVKLMSWPILHKAYRLMAAELHPDKSTGDADDMKRLNIIFTRLKKEYFEPVQT